MRVIALLEAAKYFSFDKRTISAGILPFRLISSISRPVTTSALASTGVVVGEGVGSKVVICAVAVDNGMHYFKTGKYMKSNERRISPESSLIELKSQLKRDISCIHFYK